MFTVILINGRQYDITPEERDALLGKTGFAFLKRLNVSINTASISVIEPKNMGQVIDRTKQIEGVTPGGDIVIKRFGHWYYRDVNEYQVNESGQSILEYHGEPMLPTPQEYEQEFKYLAPSEWRGRLIKQSSEIDDRLLINRTDRKTGGTWARLGEGKKIYSSPEA